MDRDSAAQRLVDYLLRPQRYAESEDSGRQTYIGAIGDDGVAKVISDKVGKWSKTYFNQANNHGSLGWRNPDKPMIKFRACDGICYWWDQPTEEHKEEANQAVVKAGGQPIQTHVFISPNEAKSWIDRLIDKEKAESDVEYSWQRAHYESTHDGLQSELDQLASEFKDRLYVRFDIHNGNIHLHDVHAKIGLPPGTGSAFMQRLSVIADKYDSTVTLETADKGHQHSKEYKKTSSRPRLKSFYGRFGFKSNYGARSYRSDLPGNMHRIPKTVSKP